MRLSVVLLFALACGDDTSSDASRNDSDGNADGDTPLSDSGSVESTADSQTFATNTPLLSIVINEVMPGNDSTLVVDGIQQFPDWFELLNTGDESVPLAGVLLQNEDGQRWVPDEDLILEPGIPLLVIAAEEQLGDLPWTGWPLDRDGDALTMSHSDGRTIDRVSFGDTRGDVSYARFGDGPHQATARPTPGQVNPEAPSETLDPASETVFTTDSVRQIVFSITVQDYQFLDDAAMIGEKPEIHAGIEIDGVVYDDIGLRLKGSASLESMDLKPAFIADFNEWVPGQRFRGLKALKFHNGIVLDPTRTREFMSYKVAEALGMLAPRVGWADVHIDVEQPDGTVHRLYYGIYMLVEKHDDVLLERLRPDSVDTGILMEPNDPADLSKEYYHDFRLGIPPNWQIEEGPDPLPEGALDVLFAANESFSVVVPTPEQVEENWVNVDKEKFFTYLAWEGVVGHWDGAQHPNNWRVFIDGSTGLVEFVPSGADWTWDPESPATLYLGPDTIGGRAPTWCLISSACAAEYAQYVLKVADVVDSLNLIEDFEALSAWLDPLIQADPRYQTFENVVEGRAKTLQALEEFTQRARDETYERYPELNPATSGLSTSDSATGP